MKTRTGLAVILLGVAAAKACAQRPSVEVGVATHAKYEIRGIAISNSPVIQPEIALDYKQCGALAATTYTMHRERLTDYALGTYCSADAKGISVTPKLMLLGTLPDGTTTEAAVKLKHKLSPTLLVAHDFKAHRGTYVEASTEHERKIGPVPLSLDAAVAFNHRYYRPESGMSHVELGLSTPITYRGLAVTPAAHLCREFGGKNEYNAGLHVSKRF